MDGKEPPLRAAGPVQGWTLFAGHGVRRTRKGATVRRLSVALGAATLLAASFLAPASAWAAANPETTIEHNATETFHDQGGTSSGRFTNWGGFNTDTTGQQANGTFTFSLTVKSGVGAGTHFNEVSHFTGPVDADGNPIFSLAKVAFDRANCH